MPAEPTPSTLSAPLVKDGGPKGHWSLDVKFPVYAIAFTNDDTIVLGGGGGSSRTGVKNRLSTYSIDVPKRTFNLKQEHELSKEEDAPMTIAVQSQIKALVAGINSSADKLKAGKNENLRVFALSDDGVKFEKAKQTITSTNEDHYQKVTAFSRSKPSLLAIGSTNSQMSLLTYPELEEVYPSIEYDGDELYDVDFNDSGDMLVGTSSNKLCVWSTKNLDKDEPQEAVQVIERPVLKKTLTCTFRAAKFGRQSTKDHIYTIVNAAPVVRTRKPAKGDKKSFVSLWDTKSWKLVKTRTISQKPVTAFDVSDDGTLLAYGSSDLSVGVLDATTLQPILHILHAHDFPVTSLKFNPSGTLVVSGSADNSVRVIQVPSKDERSGMHNSGLWSIVLTVLILLIAIFLQWRYDLNLLKAAGVA